jgi:hypothetical protein
MSEKLNIFLGITTVAFLGATIGLAVTKPDAALPEPATESVAPQTLFEQTLFENPAETSIFASEEDNTCAGKKVDFPNVDCVHLTGPGPQAGGNVTKGYVGKFETESVPLDSDYWKNSMCAVNVHWHLGTEHYSVGEYDESGDGPNGNADPPTRRLGEDVRGGFRCHHYNATDAKFTAEYEWKYCKDMKVGETYEVHWPHSAAGACGTVNQYQTPFYDGVFCTDGVLDLATLPQQVGVQGQIFTIVNDESYYYPDMIRGWIVDGEYGEDIHYYTGSTTGTSRNNEICSQYTPITWQVDRKCHMISASSFDKMCYDMMNQRDDMSDDLHAHGSRELVIDELVANNGF